MVCFTTKAKNPTKPPVTPNVTTIIKDAAGEKRKVTCTYDASDFSASTETCDVKLLDSVDLSETLPSWERPLAHLIAKPYYFDFNGELELTVDLEDIHERSKGGILFEKMMLK